MTRLPFAYLAAYLLGRARLKSYSARSSSLLPRRPLGFLAFTFFMPSPLTRRRPASTDQPDSSSALGEQYHEEPATIRLSNQNEAALASRMVWVIHHLGERIAEYRDRLLEGDRVLREIDDGLAGIPFEA